MEEYDLELVNPLHLQLVHDGHGEYPSSYKVTKAGMEKIKGFFKIIKELEDE